MKREVIRILTPGTVVEEHLLDERSSNYLASVVCVDGTFGLAAAECSTGDLMVTEFSGQSAWAELADELARLDPTELLIAEDDPLHAIGFFDENFEMAVEDVDYSLSVLEVGLSVVYNGYIEALHLEGATRGNSPETKSPEHMMQEQLGLQYLFEKWQGLDFKRFTREAQG